MTCALVTGAGHRLGRAMALCLAEAGYDVALHYASSGEGAKKTVAEIEAMGRKSVALNADFLNKAETEHLVADASRALGGPLSVLINNASIFEYDTLETVTEESWERHMGSNLRAPFVLTQAFAKQAPKSELDKRGEALSKGLVVNMLDQRVRKLTPEFMSYTLAKMGLAAFTQTAAQALAPDIRVNAIAPGPTLIGARQSEAHFAKQRAGTILKRGSNLEDITGALTYFLNAPAVTGQILCVDGGQHLGWQTPDIIGKNL